MISSRIFSISFLLQKTLIQEGSKESNSCWEPWTHLGALDGSESHMILWVISSATWTRLEWMLQAFWMRSMNIKNFTSIHHSTAKINLVNRWMKWFQTAAMSVEWMLWRDNIMFLIYSPGNICSKQSQAAIRLDDKSWWRRSFYLFVFSYLNKRARRNNN